MGDRTVKKDDSEKWWKTVWARVIAVCVVAIAIIGGINQAAEFAGNVNKAKDIVVGPEVTTTTVTVLNTVLEQAITTLTVDPPEVTGPVNEVPQLKVSINRLNRKLAGAALMVGESVCRKAINLEIGKADPIECDVPAAVLEQAVIAATTVNVRLTAPDGTDESVVVPLDLSPARCADPRTPSAENARITATELEERWTWVLTDPASPGCETWDQPWKVDQARWETSPDGWIKQRFGLSGILFQVNGDDEILNLVVTVYKDDADALDEVNTAVSAVFSRDIAEMNSLLDLGLNRSCEAGGAYAITETADELATTITVEICTD